MCGFAFAGVLLPAQQISPMRMMMPDAGSPVTGTQPATLGTSEPARCLLLTAAGRQMIRGNIGKSHCQGGKCINQVVETLTAVSLTGHQINKRTGSSTNQHGQHGTKFVPR